MSFLIRCKSLSTTPEFILTSCLLEDGNWLSKESTGLQSRNFQYLLPQLWGEAEDSVQSPMANNIINHVYIMELP